ncbi:MAG: L,D-transpeptidase family protein [Chthoniobacteraceae bacterium]|nr:L,D-transpeptidase family protein [Chthoniobacteraceae bacterium]
MRRSMIVLLSGMSLLAGCALDPRLDRGTQYLGDNGSAVSTERGRASFDNVSYWDGDNVSGAPSIIIRLSEQRAYFFKGSQLVGVSSISTGREGHNTPAGNFRIIQKDKDHASSRYGDYIDAQTGAIVKKDIDRLKDPMPKGAKYDGAKMPYFMEIVPAVGMHEGFLPGVPASHGCIRMPGFMAEAFFRNVSLKTPVRVIP